MNSALFARVERSFRHLLERAGGLLDFAFNRDAQPQFDLSSLLPRIESALERSLREERGRLAVPHLIELRYSYEIWTALGAAQREQLERDLAANLFEYAHNRRYLMAAPMKVTITCDAFTSGVEIHPSFGPTFGPSFGESAPAPRRVASQASQASLANQTGRANSPRQESPFAPARIVLVELGRGLRHEALLVQGAEPVGIGRNIANKMVINDPGISNFHAAFVWRENGGIELADRGGANGTAINGVPLGSADRRLVSDGDLIRLGRIDCRLLIGE